MTKYIPREFISSFYPYLLIGFFSLVLIAIWFGNGRILASSESALPFENLSRYVDLTANAWSNYALGNYPGFTSASYLTYVFLFGLTLVGLPGFLVEAIFFYFLFVVAGVAVYELGKELFPETQPLFLLSGVVFYWFNPFTLVNIWNRFLYNYMVFYTLFPLVVWLFLRGLRLRKYIYGFYIGIASLFFSYASTSPAFDFLLWFVLGGITVLQFLWISDKKGKLFAIKFLAFTLITYILFNLWWISQMFSYSVAERFSPSTQTFFNSIDNLDTVEKLSFRLGNLSEIFRLMHHDFYQNQIFSWIQFFSRDIAVGFEFMILMVVLFVSWKQFNKQAVLLCCLFVLFGFFLMKGSSPPLGDAVLWLFVQFPILHLFRNPFEKFGFLVPVFFAPLLGYSFYVLSQYSKLFKRFSFILLFLLVYFYGKPFLTKELFSYQDNSGVIRDYSVDVPSYYQEANKWLTAQGNNFRIIAFPLGGEGITYNWKYPFSGVESTNTLLDVPSISYNTTILYYSDISSKIQEDFLYDPAFFTKISKLNIRYILLRADINFQERQMMNPELIRKRLEFYQSQGLLRPAKTFDQLSFWEVTDWKDVSITANTRFDSATPVQSFKLINQESSTSALIDNSVAAVVSDIDFFQNWVLPDDVLGIDSVVNKGYERDQNIFPFISYLSTDTLYPLVRWKEKIQLGFIFNQKNKMEAEVFLLGKRISEMEFSRYHRNWSAFDKSATSYQVDFLSFIQELEYYAKNPDSQYQNWKSNYLNTIFNRHLNYFSSMLSNPDLSDTSKKIVEEIFQIAEANLQKNYIIPSKTELNDQANSFGSWKIYQFKDIQKGSYQFISANKVGLPAESQILYNFVLDGNVIQRNVRITKDQRLDFGIIDLEAGNHELALQPLDVGQEVKYSSFMIEEAGSAVVFSNYDPSTLFYLQFQYLLPPGSELVIEQEHDNSIFKDGQIMSNQLIALAPMVGEKIATKHQLIYPGEGSSQTRLLFNLKNPFCAQSEYTSQECLQIELSNFMVKRYKVVEPVLYRQKQQEILRQPSIAYQKRSESVYDFNIQNLNERTVLILNQLYHPGWKLILNGKKIDQHILVNSYANGWIVDQSGSYEGSIEFSPDRYYKLTQIISASGVIIFAAFFIGKSLKNYYENH